MRILVSNSDYLITMDRERRVIRNGSVAIEDGKIAQVGKKSEVERSYSKAYFDRVIDAEGKVVTPGFVDTHVHTHEHLARGLFPDNVKTEEWTRDWAYRIYGSTTPTSEYVSALLCCADMLRTGTTCFLESGVRFPESLVRAVKEAGIRAGVGPRVMDNAPKRVPAGWSDQLVEALFKSTDEAVKELKETAEKCDGQANGRVRAFVTINGKTTCTDELYVRASELSRERDLGMHFHIASSLEEAVESERSRGCWPITHLERIGVLQDRIVLAHATAVKDKEVGILSRRGVKVSFCPGSAFKLGKGASTLGRYPEMLKAGVTVSLGSDGAAAAGSLDMVRQVQMAAGIIKDGRRDAAAISAEECLEMGTIGGAKALRWEKMIGSLEADKSADLVVFNARHLIWLPLNDPVQNLVYSASGESVETVLVDGRVVVESGRLTTLDEDRLQRLVSEEATQSISRSGLKPRRKWPYS